MLSYRVGVGPTEGGVAGVASEGIDVWVGLGVGVACGILVGEGVHGV